MTTRTSKAFSLIEVIAAVIVLEMIVLSLMALFSFNNNMTRVNEDRIVVYELLQRKAEEVRLRNFATNVTQSGVSYTDFPGYQIDVSQEIPFSGSATLKRIVITVNWITPGGVYKQEQLALVVANHG